MRPYDPEWLAYLESLSELVTESGCRIWTGTNGNRGYGQTKHRQRNYSAHRAMWVAMYGPVPPHVFVCHRCDVRCCVRLDHLFLGTVLDNNQDRARKGRSAKPRAEAIEMTLHCAHVAAWCIHQQQWQMGLRLLNWRRRAAKEYRHAREESTP